MSHDNKGMASIYTRDFAVYKLGWRGIIRMTWADWGQRLSYVPNVALPSPRRRHRNGDQTWTWGYTQFDGNRTHDGCSILV